MVEDDEGTAKTTDTGVEAAVVARRIGVSDAEGAATLRRRTVGRGIEGLGEAIW